MGSRTIDFWLEFGDEFLVCAIEARWRFPQISTLICGCKNQQNIENQCFCLETQFRTKPREQSRNGTSLCVDPPRFQESFEKVFPIPEGKIQWKWGGLRSFLRDGFGSPASIVD